MSTQTDSAAPPFNSNPKRPFTGSCHCGQIRYIVFLRLPSSSFSNDGNSLKNIALPPLKDREKDFGPLPNGFYRCNCTGCHKMGLFHLRPEDPFEDFWLISPLPDTAAATPRPSTILEGDSGTDGGLKGLKGIGNYSPKNDDENHFWFCDRCGVRPFSFSGRGKLERVKLQPEEKGRELESELEWPKPRIKLKQGEEILVWKPVAFPTPSSGSSQQPPPSKSGRPHKFYLSINAITINDQPGLNLRKFQDEKMVGYLDELDNEKGIRWGDADEEGKGMGPMRGGIW